MTDYIQDVEFYCWTQCKYRGRKMANLTRFQVELPEDQLKDLERLQGELGFRTKKELLNAALGLLEWHVRQRHQGRVIMSVNHNEKSYRELSFPALDRIKPD